MSWDLAICDFGSWAKVEDIPTGFQPAPLGARSEVILKISEILPTTDFSDLSWGVLETDTCSIEFNVGQEETTDSVMLHVRGGGSAMALIARLLNGQNWRAIDCQTGEFFEAEESNESFMRWQRYRDQVISDKSSEQK